MHFSILNFTSLYFSTLNITTLHITTLNDPTLNYPTLQFSSKYFIILHFSPVHLGRLHFSPLHCSEPNMRMKIGNKFGCHGKYPKCNGADACSYHREPGNSLYIGHRVVSLYRNISVESNIITLFTGLSIYFIEKYPYTVNRNKKAFIQGKRLYLTVYPSMKQSLSLTL